MSREKGNPDKPKLLVFDLDYTLWPFWVDTHISFPCSKKNNHVIDHHGVPVDPYRESESVLKHLHSEGYQLGVASRTGEVQGAEELLKLFDWNKFFSYQQIYPGRKTTHIQRIHEMSGVDFNDMIFFDDEERNIRDVSKIGVLSIFVPNGVNLKLVNSALEDYKRCQPKTKD